MIFLNIEIKDKKENILLSRIEVEADLSFEKGATPSAEDIKKELSKALEVEADLIAIKKIDGSFGNTQAKVVAYQYLSKDDLKNIEPKEKKKAEEISEQSSESLSDKSDKKPKEAAAKKPEGKKEAAAEEKSAEEKKEEKKEEPKQKEKKE